jgi:hypothetical protein
MQPNILKDPTAKAPWSVIHPLSEEDSAAVAALRSVVAPMKGKVEGTAGRGPFNDIMERVAVPKGGPSKPLQSGGYPGWWPGRQRPERGRNHSRAWRLVHLGTAQAYRNFLGHIALSAQGFRPVFEWVEEKQVTPVCMIYLTDLCCHSYPAPPDYPVLCCNRRSIFLP